MARSFNASTDTVEYAAANIAATTAMSFCAWVKGPSVGDTTSRMLACQEDQWRINFNAEKYGGGTPTAGSLYFGRSWGTTDQLTEVASPGATWANDNHVACCYDGASTTNAAQFYLNGVPLTNSETRNAAGTIDNATGNPNVGNDNAHARSCLADISFASMHSVKLTQAEVLEHMYCSHTGRSRILAWDMSGDSPERDRSGNGRTGTVTGTTVVANSVRMGTPFPVEFLSSPRSLPVTAITVIAPSGTITLSAPAHTTREAVIAAPGGVTLNAGNATISTVMDAVSALLTLSSASPSLTESVLALTAGMTLDGPSPIIASSVITVSGPLTMDAAAATITEALRTTSGTVTLGAASPVALDTITASPGGITLDAPDAQLRQLLQTVAANMTLGAGAPAVIGQNIVLDALAGTLTLSGPDGIELLGVTVKGNNWFILSRRRRI